jgi:hypothetical protein
MFGRASRHAHSGQHDPQTALAVSTALPMALTASKAISFRELENKLRNLIGEEPIIDRRSTEFPGRSVFMIVRDDRNLISTAAGEGWFLFTCDTQYNTNPSLSK